MSDTTFTIDDLIKQLARIPELEKRIEELKKSLEYQRRANADFEHLSTKWNTFTIMGRVHYVAPTNFMIDNYQFNMDSTEGLQRGDIAMAEGSIYRVGEDDFAGRVYVNGHYFTVVSRYVAPDNPAARAEQERTS